MSRVHFLLLECEHVLGSILDTAHEGDPECQRCFPPRFGGERIVFTFVCPEPTDAAFWVYERASGELRGDSGPGECRVDALFNFDSGEILVCTRGRAPRRRCAVATVSTTY